MPQMNRQPPPVPGSAMDLQRGLGCMQTMMTSVGGYRLTRLSASERSRGAAGGRGCGDRAYGASSFPLRGSSRRTAIRVSPRSRTLARSPCSAGWSVSMPEMTVSSLWPLTCRPSNQAAHWLSRTPATRISYHAGPPEAVTSSPASSWSPRPSPRQPPAAAAGERWSRRVPGAGVVEDGPVAAGQVASGLAGGHQDHLVGTFGFTGHGRSGRRSWASAEGVPVRWNLRRPAGWYRGCRLPGPVN
jgi:hypothetical protein